MSVPTFGENGKIFHLGCVYKVKDIETAIKMIK